MTSLHRIKYFLSITMIRYSLEGHFYLSLEDIENFGGISGGGVDQEDSAKAKRLAFLKRVCSPPSSAYDDVLQ